MNLIETLTRLQNPERFIREATLRKPMGPGFTVEQACLSTVKTMEVWGTNFNDPGLDEFHFILKDKDGNKIASATVPGY